MAIIDERKSKSGKVSYRVRIRLKGHPTQSASFKRKTDAQRWAASTESAILEGRHFKQSEAKRHSLADLIDRYIRDVLPQKSDSMQRDQYTQLTWWKDKIGERLLADVSPTLIAEHRDILLNQNGFRGKKRSPSSVNRYLAALSHAFSIAVKEWGWIEDSPIRKVQKPKEPRGRVRFLDDEERENLLKACRESENPMIFPIVVFALSTGARKMEILNLTWKDIDINRKVAIIQESKNDERRALPLAGQALEEIKKLANIRRIGTNLVFLDQAGEKPVNIRIAWEKALVDAKIKDFRFHDLRHSTASYLAMNGATLAEIAQVLGHKTLQMVKRYSHLSDQHTAGVITRMNEKIFGTK
ncbi:MAG: integrase [Nitrospinae bacterium CG11_big_fil_rev_8_21_14_0_20_45_15]|nr:MAG: integrase [Nitrospinae bacterium CG11_big_fil_rev_8_21_14_0_20_45_15]